MVIIYGCYDITTKEKIISPYSEIPCGVYKFLVLELNCLNCSGMGGEEVSGGHKNECIKCWGTGLNPSRLRIFEDEDPNNNAMFLSGVKRHSYGCSKCDSIADQNRELLEEGKLANIIAGIVMLAVSGAAGAAIQKAVDSDTLKPKQATEYVMKVQKEKMDFRQAWRLINNMISIGSLVASRKKRLDPEMIDQAKSPTAGSEMPAVRWYKKS